MAMEVQNQCVGRSTSPLWHHNFKFQNHKPSFVLTAAGIVAAAHHVIRFQMPTRYINLQFANSAVNLQSHGPWSESECVKVLRS